MPDRSPHVRPRVTRRAGNVIFLKPIADKEFEALIQAASADELTAVVAACRANGQLLSPAGVAFLGLLERRAQTMRRPIDQYCQNIWDSFPHLRNTRAEVQPLSVHPYFETEEGES
ncbi:hypothetical protein [Povalibacter sp.]|uniref:hypothetical protein n=1 Tax=Povalibacter sp. TaxID=1962978 RepID=UPI002F3EFEC2